MILVIDNYDSFVYNLVQYFGRLGATTAVYRNDAITPGQIRELAPSAILISPGPCSPAEAGVSVDVIRELAGEIPILGVCLGHQSIGYAFGATVRRAREPMHGKLSRVTHYGTGVFARLENPFEVVRYHSLVLDGPTLPACLEVTAVASDGEIMGVRHRILPVEGVQFHPESIFTAHGMRMLENFLAAADQWKQRGHLLEVQAR